MAHYDVLLDLGYDYGADGGLAWDTGIISFPNGLNVRNMRRSRPIGAWQLGNRNVDRETLDYLQGFLHAMRGRAHTFLYKDWTDYEAREEQIIPDGDEIQLIKSYGRAINPWVRDITKPVASSVIIEMNDGSGWVGLDPDTDYTLDDSTGLVTLAQSPESGDLFRWSGEFYVPVRFDRDVLSAQFLGYEERADGTREHAYAIGGLMIVEELYPEDPS